MRGSEEGCLAMSVGGIKLTKNLLSSLAGWNPAGL